MDLQFLSCRSGYETKPLPNSRAMIEISPVTLTHSVTNCAIQNLQFRMLAGNRFSQDVTELVSTQTESQPR